VYLIQVKMENVMKQQCLIFCQLSLACLCIVMVSGCSNMTHTQQRVLSGAAIGAGVGTAATVLTDGCVACGAAVGAAAGAAGGYVYDKTKGH
jgi:hypothetical protein